MTDERESGTRSRIELVARSHVGMLRTRNEDVVSIDVHQRWAVLADGMGGYQGGEVAARIAVDQVDRALASRFQRGWSVEQAVHGLTRAVQEANTGVYRASQLDADIAFMGSTLVAAVFLDGVVVSAHVGDSRLYRLRAGSCIVEQLTRDHTVLQEQVDFGLISADDAREIGARGPLTRGLGVTADVMVEAGVHAGTAGDLFLLCSDGLSDMLTDEDIRALLLIQAPLEATADSLIQAANLHGGRDNVSVVLARIIV